MSILAAEYASNALGGRLLIECEGQGGWVDEVWLKLLMFVISNECGEHEDIINGIVASSRKPKQANIAPRASPRRPSSSSPSHPPAPGPSSSSSGYSTSSSAQTDALLRIEIWVHSSAHSSSTGTALLVEATTAVPATVSTSVDVDSNAVPVVTTPPPKTARLMEDLRVYLDRDGSSLGTRASTSIRYRPHGCA